MKCERVDLGKGSYAWICKRGVRARQCACGGVAVALCDGPVMSRKSRTCDAPVCAKCRVHTAPDRDLCPAHASGDQLALRLR